MPNDLRTLLDNWGERSDLNKVVAETLKKIAQAFIPAIVDNVARIKAIIGDRSVDIEIDGGVTPQTAPLVVAAGANVLVAGSAIFKGGTPADYARNIDAIRSSVKDI